MKRITKEELGNNIVEKRHLVTEEEGIMAEVDWTYSFFNPKDGMKEFSFLGYTVPLSTDNYGFPDSRMVRIKERCEIRFSPAAQELYNNVFAEKEIPLNVALDTIAKCINDSMEYNKNYIELGRVGRLDFDEDYKEAIGNSGYVPRGDETLIGICDDAGDIIRKVLGEILDDSSLRYVDIGAMNNVGNHDTTLVFDIKNGNWAAINSKSPLKPYNLVPKEKLAELGHPYT